MKHIRTLKITDSININSPSEILNEEKKFYENLYSSVEYNESEEAQNDHFFNNIPKLNADDKQLCDQGISIEECTKALKELKNGKTPGSDGFPPEFYKMFWKNISNLVYESISHAFTSGTMSIEQRRGVLNLIPKKDKDQCFLKNWRPITLLNTDYKIIAQLFAMRLQKVLPKIISEHQNGYIKNRFVGYNIRTICDIILYTSSTNTPCLITFLDFEKAFDQLEWRFIQKALKAYDFGEYFRKWVAVMYENVTSCVTNNGYSSQFFKVTRGIRQGCPLSALLFIMAVEILSLQIQNNKGIKGIQINNREIKISQLADDTTLFLGDVDSLKEALKALSSFSKISGLSLNKSKSEIIKIGDNIKGSTFCGIRTVKKTCSLGIWYFDNMAEIMHENHTDRLKNFSMTLNHWKARNLSLYGKTTVLKSVAFPKLTHVIANLATPEWFVHEVQNEIFNFLWDNKPPKIKNKVIINSVEKGGLKIPHVDSFVKAQKAIWCKRMLLNNQTCWLELLKTYLPCIKLADLLKCHTDPTCLADGIPPFYRQVLFAWFDLKVEPSNALEVAREIIWLNKYIQVSNECLWNKNLYKSGLLCLGDLITETGKFLTREEFYFKFKVTPKPLFFMSLIDAIPQQWRLQLKANNPQLVNHDELPFLKINGRDKIVTLLSSKDLYWKFLATKEDIPSCINNWNDRLKLNLAVDDWKNIFTLPQATVRETRVLEMQFKILHRCYAARSKVHKWDPSVPSICNHCHRETNILHEFFLCNVVQVFWQMVTAFLNTICSYHVNNLTVEDVILGKYCGIKHDVLNHVILYAKYHIHNQINKQREPNFEQFRKFYKYAVEVERERYIFLDKRNLFEQRFGRVLEYLLGSSTRPNASF